MERELKTEYVKGAIHEADKGILIVNIRSLLLDITQWDKLKQALLFGEYEPNSVNHSPYLSAKEKSTFKLILVGKEKIFLLYLLMMMGCTNLGNIPK